MYYNKAYKKRTQIGAHMAIEVGLIQKLKEIKILANTSNFLSKDYCYYNSIFLQIVFIESKLPKVKCDKKESCFTHIDHCPGNTIKRIPGCIID